MIHVAALYFSFLLTTLLVLLFMKMSTRLGVLIDQPNSRKVHIEPVPKTGGPAVVVGSLIPIIILFRGDKIILGLCLGAMFILVMGIMDDLWNLDYRWKFVGQILAATVTLLVSGVRLHTIGEFWQGFPQDLGLLGLPLAVVFLVATTNMINLSDGLDGLAGGICFLIFCAVGFLAYFQADFRLLALSICILGAIAGFLRYNSHPAIVFLGDTGSQFLGFTAGFSLLLLTQIEIVYSPLITLYLMGVPIIDTSTVILERLRQGLPVFKADKNHIHHKLLRLGLRHNESVAVIYALQLGMIVIAWTGRAADDGLLLVSFLCFAGLSIFVFNLSSKLTKSINSANKNSNPAPVSVRGGDQISFIRNIISRLTWYGVVGLLCLFYFISPFLLESVPTTIGVFSFSVIVCLLLLKKLDNSHIRLILTISIYFLSLYYIFFTEYSQNSIYLQFQYRTFYNILFFILGMCCIGNLISNFERKSFSTNDFLMFAVVVFLFFLPKNYDWTMHIRTIAMKTFVILLCIDLVSKKLEDKMNFVFTPAIVILGLNSLASLFSFIR